MSPQEAARMVGHELGGQSMSKHTPTPWEVSDTGDGWNISAIRTDSSGVHVHRIACKLDSESNAALIVRAVNAHEQLVEALRELLRDEAIYDDDAPELTQSRAKARAALRAAGVEP